MTPRSPTPPKSASKALPPIYVVVKHDGEIDFLTLTSSRKVAADDAKLFIGDRVVKYVPVPPRARRGK